MGFTADGSFSSCHLYGRFEKADPERRIPETIYVCIYGKRYVCKDAEELARLIDLEAEEFEERMNSLKALAEEVRLRGKGSRQEQPAEEQK